jgi:hypothetical protein
MLACSRAPSPFLSLVAVVVTVGLQALMYAANGGHSQAVLRLVAIGADGTAVCVLPL